MKLNSPRQDPYSSVNTALDKLQKKGYSELFTVMDETHAKDSKGNTYKPKDMTIDEIHRFKGNKNWFNNQDGPLHQSEIFALNASNGVKGTINREKDEEGWDVVETFLQNVDRHDNLHESYS